jgi:hypothetical protein
MAGFFLSSRFRLAAAVCAGLIAGNGTAQAQGWGFFDNFFGGGQQRQVQPAAPELSKPRRRVVPRPAPLDSEAAGSKAAARKPGEPEPAHGVVVLGDNFAQPLANGLDEALSDRPDVAVLHKARDGTGLTRESFFDWPKAIREFLDAKPAGAAKIDAAVIMIGINDMHSLSEGGKSYAYDTDEWTAIYTRRVVAICEAFAAKKIPLVWVGIPITADDTVADDMAALNDIFRDAATKTGTVFVDTWEAFSNADGDFAATGPDVNGLIIRLRSADGLRFTKAGARKLAHFAEGDIRRILDQVPDLSQPAAIAALPGPTTPDKDSPGAAIKPPVKPEAGPVIVLTAPPLAENGRLDSPAVVPLSTVRPDPLIDAALVKGEPQAPRPGRADDSSWPPK